MNFFKPKDYTVYSPVSGQVIDLSDVKDEMFSKAMMGPGTAIIPTDGNIASPFDGQVKFVFPTKHALGLISASGVELLIHIGIDTVNLEGKHFEVLVKDNQRVKKGQALVCVDLEALIQLKVDPTVILVLTSASEFNLQPIEPKPVQTQEPLILISKK